MQKPYPRFVIISALLAITLNSFSAGNIGQLSQFFIENKGQIKGKTSADVLFYNTSGRMQVFITKTGYSIVTKESNAKGTTYHRADITLENVKIDASSAIMVKGVHPTINVYRPEFANGLEGIQSASTLIFKNIYPGIDWMWSIDKNGRVEHNFMVNIGADASAIKYKVSGGNITGNDSIITIANEGMTVHEGPTLIRQREKTFSPGIKINGSQVTFQVPAELKAGGYTIDPPVALDWTSGVDTILHTAFRSIVADDSFNTYTAGYSGDYSLPVFPEVNGSYISEDVQDQDAVIVKTDVGDRIKWITFFGGSNNDQANAIAITPTGIFVTGYSESWNFPLATSGNYNKVVALSGRDAFIAKFTTLGVWKWATGYGGSGTDEAMDVKYYNGNIFVGGYTTSKDFPVFQKSGAYFFDDTLISATDGFILEFDTVGNQKWATYFGGEGNNYISSLFADNTGTYVTGYSDSIVGTSSIPLQSFGSAYFQNTFQNTESFIARFTTTDALQWSTYFGGAGNDYANCILRNGTGVFVCGKTTGSGLPVLNPNVGNFYQGTYGGGGSDGFILKLDPNTLQNKYCTYYGGAFNDVLTSLSSDTNNYTVFTGFTNGPLPVLYPSSDFFTINTNAGGTDALMLGLDANQNIFWSTLFGTTGNDFGLSVHVFLPYVVDMVGEGLYDYGKNRIGGTYRSTSSPYPLVTCNGESNRFINVDALGGGGGGSGGGPGGGFPLGGNSGGGCGFPLYYQALIPLRNTCPQECNGGARVDTSFILGCPPYSSLWSDGGTLLTDSGLCENYWNQITDANGNNNIMYGRFDVLRVENVGTLKVNCNQVPDWAKLIVPLGGGPPYTIFDRGTTGNGCPNTEFFEITDTSQCVVNYDVDWDVLNASLTDSLTLNPSCSLLGTVNVGNSSQCIDLSVSGGWQYVLWTGTDTTKIPFSGSSSPQELFQGLPGKSYTGYLNMGSCTTPLNPVFVFAPLVDTITHTNSCNDNGTITITVQPDTAALKYLGSYKVSYSVIGNGQTYPGTITFSSNQAQTAKISNLTGAGYVVDLSIPNSCDTASTSVKVVAIDFTFNNATAYCGRQDTLTASVVGATPPLSFNWSGGSSSDSELVITTAGNYALIVEDNNGCSIHHSIQVPGSTGFQVTITENTDPCTNTLYTNANAVVLGGTYPYTYLWSNGQTTTSATQLLPGTDGFTVTDNFGCRDSVSFSNTKQLPMVVTATANNVTCAGKQNGSIDLNITQGYPTYQVEWSDGIQGASRSSLASGTYRYSVTDSKNCTYIGSVNLTVPDSLQYNLTSAPAFCSDSNGLADITVIGGTAPFSIIWSDGSKLFNRNNIPAESLSFSISDSNNCQVSGNVNILSHNPLTAQIVETNVTCKGGGDDGTATVIVFNAAPPVSFLWSNSSTSPFIFNQPPETVNVTITDSLHCKYFTSVTIAKQPTPIIYVDSINLAPCVGQSVLINVFTTGGTPPYLITGDTTGLYAMGSYSTNVTDSNGCTTTANFLVKDPPPIITSTQIISLPNCNSPNGKVLEITSGGNPGYSVSIGSQLLGYYLDSITVTIPPANDSIYIEDMNGCTVSQSTGFPTYIPLIASAAATAAACSGASTGAVEITIHQGVSPFTVMAQQFIDTITFGNVTAGYHTYVVTDSLGCIDSLSAFVAQPTPIIANDTIAAQNFCNSDTTVFSFFATGGTPPYTGTGPYIYLPGSYYHLVTDSNGCIDSLALSIVAPPVFTADTTVTQPGCSNQPGTFAVKPSANTGPYNIWADSSFIYAFTDTFSVHLASGSYTYHLKSIRGCILNYSFVIDTVLPVSGTITPTNNLCFGDQTGSIKINMQQGFSPFTVIGQSFNDSITLSNLSAGAQVYVVADAFGCTDSLKTVIAQPPVFRSADSITIQNVCNTDSSTVTFFALGGTPPYTGNGSFIYLPGSYNHVVIDSNGCRDSLVFKVVAPPAFTADTIIGQPDCSNGQGTFAVKPSPGSGPYSLWADSSIIYVFQDSIAIHLAPGSYTYHVTNVRNCLLDFSFSINPSPAITGKINHTDDRCFGDNTGAIEIIMQTGSAPFTVNNLPFNDSITFNSLPAGNYSYNVLDVNGCLVELGTTVGQPAQIVIDTTNSIYLVNGITCQNLSDGKFNFQVSGGQLPYEFSLVTAPTDTTNQLTGQFNNLAAGNYTVIITDFNNCKVSLPVSVPAYIPTINSVTTQNDICSGSNDGVIKLFSQPAIYSPYTYSLNGGAPQVYNVYYNLAAGNYQVIISSAYNCLDTVYASITQPDSIDPNVYLNGQLLPVDSFLILEQNVAIFTKNNTHPWAITFSPAQTELVNTDTLIDLKPLEDVTYTVTVYQDSVDTSCNIQYKGLLIVVPVASIPNIITPNGDGVNDRWEIDLDIYANAKVTIFDRWGETIYHSDSYNNDWAGTYTSSGKRVPDGTYFYIMTLASKPGVVFKGDINVLDSGN